MLCSRAPIPLKLFVTLSILKFLKSLLNANPTYRSRTIWKGRINIWFGSLFEKWTEAHSSAVIHPTLDTRKSLAVIVFKLIVHHPRQGKFLLNKDVLECRHQHLFSQAAAAVTLWPTYTYQYHSILIISTMYKLSYLTWDWNIYRFPR